ncbi:conserved hypothetical protein [Ricinus communis]|uniref:NB-ARC domain-containing protein n=1 Tax=Ricinus communis TaxID=3988 RepID=B9SPW2_RICCO|nr:conserved hypothetical protein [Ricinus communis]
MRVSTQLEKRHGIHPCTSLVQGVLDQKEGIDERKVSCKMPRASCLIDEYEIYDRDDDKEAIMKLLLTDDPNGKDAGIIPIVGYGGVSKTTIAQLQ